MCVWNGEGGVGGGVKRDRMRIVIIVLVLRYSI